MTSTTTKKGEVMNFKENILRENKNKQTDYEQIRFDDMMDNSKVAHEVIGAVIKELTLLSPEGIRQVAEAVKTTLAKHIVIDINTISERALKDAAKTAASTRRD